MIPCVLFILFIKNTRVYLLYLIYSLLIIIAATATSPPQHPSTLIETPKQTEFSTILSGTYSSLSPPITKSASLAIADSANGQPLLSTTPASTLSSTLFVANTTNSSESANADVTLIGQLTTKAVTNAQQQQQHPNESGSPTTLAVTNYTNLVSIEQSNQQKAATQVNSIRISDQNEDESRQTHDSSAIINNRPTYAPTTSATTVQPSSIPFTSWTNTEQQPIQFQSNRDTPSSSLQQVHQHQTDTQSRQQSPYVQQTGGKETLVAKTKEPSEVTSGYQTITLNSNDSNDDYSESDDATITTSTILSETVQNHQQQHAVTLAPDIGTTATIDSKLSLLLPDARYHTSSDNGQANPLTSTHVPSNNYYSRQPSLVISNIPNNIIHNFPTTTNEIITDNNNKISPVENSKGSNVGLKPIKMINNAHFSNHDSGNKNINSTTSNNNLLSQITTTPNSIYFSNSNTSLSPDARSLCVTAAYLCVIFVNKTFDECDQNLCSSNVVDTSSDMLDEETLQQVINRMLEEKFAVVELKSDIHPLLYHQESILTFSPASANEQYIQKDEKPPIHQHQRQQQSPVMIVDENKQQQQDFFKQSLNNQILTPMYSKTKLDSYNNNERFRQQQTTTAPMQSQTAKLELQQQELQSDSILGWIPITFPPLSSLGLSSFPSSSFPSDRTRHLQHQYADPLYPRQHLDNQLRSHNGQAHNMLHQQESKLSQEFYLDFPLNDNSEVMVSGNGEEKALNKVKKTTNGDSDNAMSSSTATRIQRPHKRPHQQIANKYESVSTTLSELLSGSLMHSQSTPTNMIGSNSAEIDSEMTNEGSNINNKPVQLVNIKNKNLHQHTKQRHKPLQPQTSASMFSSMSNQATKIPAISFLNKNNEMASQSTISDDSIVSNGNKWQTTNENLSSPDPSNTNCNKCDTIPATSTSAHSNQASVSIKSLTTEVTFTLYTRHSADSNQNKNEASSYNGDVLDLNNDTTIEQSHLNKSYPVKFIIHGFGSGGKRPWVMDMAYKLLDFDKVNVIVVDWEKGAVLPNYVQAASNTRFVGHRIACLIKRINSKFGLSGDNYHLIGFSLGAHVAGYAGMEIRNSTNNSKHWINRITGLDPASPLFEGYDAYHRLDPSDAQFVDVIHSNGDGVLRGGLGSLQPMGHVDFYPNGGRVQVGCNSVIVSALSDIIYGKWQTLCNHRRALNFFMDTLETNSCKFRSFNCESYESYLRGECFECGINHEKCSEMGYSTDRTEGRGKMYLTTSETGPFCANQFVIKLIGTSGYSTYWGKVEVVLLTNDGRNETYLLSATNQVGDDNNDDYVGHVQSLIVAQATLNNFTQVLLRYTKYKGWIYSGQENWSIDKLYITDSEGQVKSYCGYNTLLGSQLLTKLRLESHNCTIEIPTSNSKQQYLSSSTQIAVTQHPITTRSGRFFWLSHGSTNAQHTPTNIW